MSLLKSEYLPPVYPFYFAGRKQVDMSYIYVITNDINNKQYVGKTNNSIMKRWKQHISDSKRQKCKQRPLYNAINKYGIEHFSIKQLEECNESIVDEREQYWIQKLNTYGKTGYNATLGGDSKHYYNYQEIANKYLELQNQKETAKYFNCDAQTVRIACIQTNTPILSSTEVLKKSFQKVAMLNKETEEIIKIFDSVKEAQKFLNKGSGGHIAAVCQGKRKSIYGYKWKYI